MVYPSLSKLDKGLICMHCQGKAVAERDHSYSPFPLTASCKPWKMILGNGRLLWIKKPSNRLRRNRHIFCSLPGILAEPLACFPLLTAATCVAWPSIQTDLPAPSGYLVEEGVDGKNLLPTVPSNSTFQPLQHIVLFKTAEGLCCCYSCGNLLYLCCLPISLQQQLWASNGGKYSQYPAGHVDPRMSCGGPDDQIFSIIT